MRYAHAAIDGACGDGPDHTPRDSHGQSPCHPGDGRVRRHARSPSGRAGGPRSFGRRAGGSRVGRARLRGQWGCRLGAHDPGEPENARGTRAATARLSGRPRWPGRAAPPFSCSDRNEPGGGDEGPPRDRARSGGRPFGKSAASSTCRRRTSGAHAATRCTAHGRCASSR